LRLRQGQTELGIRVGGAQADKGLELDLRLSRFTLCGKGTTQAYEGRDIVRLAQGGFGKVLFCFGIVD
jgi:hypothetical protein